MKYLNIVLCLMMAFFITVQYNDPDGLLWAVIYLIPTVWAGLAAFRLQHILGDRAIAILGLSVIETLALTIYYWPTTPGFWHQDVYWVTESAREGMGMMIASFVILVAAFTIYRARKKA